MPSSTVIDSLDLRWSGDAIGYTGSNGEAEVVAGQGGRSRASLMRAESVASMLDDLDAVIVWIVGGRKQLLNGGRGRKGLLDIDVVAMWDGSGNVEVLFDERKPWEAE